jgi:hypothetical protein
LPARDPGCQTLGLLLLYGINRSSLAILADTLISEDTVLECEQRIVAADADIDTGMDAGSALSVQDVAGLDKLSVCSLGTKSLGIGVTAVLGGAHSFMVCEELKA